MMLLLWTEPETLSRENKKRKQWKNEKEEKECILFQRIFPESLRIEEYEFTECDSDKYEKEVYLHSLERARSKDDTPSRKYVWEKEGYREEDNRWSIHIHKRRIRKVYDFGREIQDEKYFCLFLIFRYIARMEYKVFGCKTNKYFAEKWLVHPHLSDKTGYFIASCVVTDKAKAKWVKHAKKKLPILGKDEKLYLSGCGNIRDGVVDPAFYDVYSELADYREKIEVLPEDPDDFGVTAEEKKEIMRTKIRSLRKIAGKELFTRKYMVIQTGCDNFCTFCLTVQARGRHKWRPMEEIIEEIHTFVEGGWKEVVFTGINLGAWWATTSNNFEESRFVELVEAVLEKTPLERLRISSLGVEFCSDALINLFKNPRINAYAHLSIQSWSSHILKSMNRHYDGEKVRAVLEKLRGLKREDGVILNIWADLIVGFPGETDKDFRDTLEIVEKYQITQLHAFPFSAHVDHYSVPAGVFGDQVPNHIAQDRLKKLLKTGEEVFEKFAKDNVWQKLRVLIEKVSKSEDGTLHFSGWSENYLYSNQTNIEIIWEPERARGKVVEWIYKYPIKQKTND
jgi:threonylcarbamoyladenosine tRNA methylthiotransferase MtaB